MLCYRETGLAGESENLLEQRKLLSVVKKNVESLCRRVNQVWILATFLNLQEFKLYNSSIQNKINPKNLHFM